MSPRYLASLLSLLGAAAVCSAAPAPVYREPPKPKVPPLEAAMQGTWELDQTALLNRRPGRPVAVVRRRTLIRIENNTWSYVYDFNGTEREGQKYSMRLDAKQSPAALDILPNQAVDGTVAHIVMKGIVKVEGDTLTFSYVHNNGQRPIQFGAAQGRWGRRRSLPDHDAEEGEMRTTAVALAGNHG